MTPEVLKLAVPIWFRVYIFGTLGVMTVVVPAILLPLILADPKADAAVALVALVPWILICGGWWLWILRMPHTIRVHEDGSLELVAIMRTVILQSRRLISISPVGFGNNFYVLKHDDGKVRLFLQFTGFYRLLAEIKAENPNFDIKGC